MKASLGVVGKKKSPKMTYLSKKGPKVFIKLFMISLGIRAGHKRDLDLKLPTYQVRANFHAVDECVLMTPVKSLNIFLAFEVSLPRCVSPYY